MLMCGGLSAVKRFPLTLAKLIQHYSSASGSPQLPLSGTRVLAGVCAINLEVFT